MLLFAFSAKGNPYDVSFGFECLSSGIRLKLKPKSSGDTKV
jgi:hypothetical protein